MGNIVLLDELTINKIAAGEVIERPASVVKELMENSIDAGATMVTAEIKNGGITYIRITDNGRGFLPDDMEIAFERHATSKIRSANDLETVKSMGFRGEALASIAAISHVELTSRTADSEVGYKIVVEGGNIISKEVAGCPKGTTIVVENLFYNTPVRYKFLKKDFTELGYVEDAVTRIAMVNPNISVKLLSLGKTIIQTTGNGNMKDCVYSIFGKDIAENLINVDYEFDGMSIKGCIGKPDVAKSNRSGQLFFVNGRFVKDKTLSSATEQALRGIIPPGKYAFLVLNLEIDPHQIDVNVHPAKLEIRFQEENKVFKLVYHAIKESILKNENEEKEKEEKEAKPEEEDILELIKEGYNTKFDQEELERQREFIYSKPENNDEISDYNSTNTNTENTDTAKSDENINEHKSSYNASNTDVENFKEETVQESGNSDNFSENIIDKEIDNAINNQIIADERNEVKQLNNIHTEEDLDSSFEEMYRKTFGKSPVENKVEEQKEPYNESIEIESAENVARIENRSIFNKIKYKLIGIAFSGYIVIEIVDDLYIIDQHLAQERIMYEKIKYSYYNNSDEDSQLMLLPDIIELTSKEMDIARDNFELFKNAGFELEEFGENTIKLSGVPNECIDLNNKDLFLEILNEINTVARTAKQEIEEKFIATVARKVADKIQIYSTFEEIDSLIQNLLVLDNPFMGSDSRAIAIKISKSEIEKKLFRR